MEEDDLKSLHPNLTQKELAQVSRDEEITCAHVCACLSIVFVTSICINYMGTDETSPMYQVFIKMISMDFVVEFDEKNILPQNKVIILLI